MIERPPLGESFKVADLANIEGTMIGDFEVVGLGFKGKDRLLRLRCRVCGKEKWSILYNANRLRGFCTHKGGKKRVDSHHREQTN